MFCFKPVIRRLLERKNGRHVLFQDAGLRAKVMECMQVGNRPACIIDYACTGGSKLFGQDLAESLIEDGRAVLYLWYNRKKRFIQGTLRHKQYAVNLALPSLALLGHAQFPKIYDFYVNEVVNWSLSRLESCLWKANGRGRARYVGAVLRQLVDVKRRHAADLHFFVHDFYALCPGAHLLDTHGTFCGLPGDAASCSRCLPATRRYRAVSLRVWREDWQYFFDQAGSVTLPSHSALSYMRQVFTLPDAVVTVRPLPAMTLFARRVNVPEGGPMVVAVVGDIALHKGARIVMELGKYFSEQASPHRIVVIGKLDTLRMPLPASVTLLGSYARHDLPYLLEKNGCTIGLLPSVIPETFSFVTQELMALGLPLVCLPLGAPPERVAAWEQGMVAEDVTWRAALKALLTLDARRTGS